MRIRNLALTGLAAAAVAYYFDPVKGSARRSRLRGQIQTLTGRAMRRNDQAPLPENVAPVSTPEPPVVGEDTGGATRRERSVRTCARTADRREDTGGATRRGRRAPRKDDAAIAEKVRARLEERSDLETGGLVIDVVRGVAYLRGELHDHQQFDEVVDLTGSVPGIRRVQSLLHLPESERVSRPQSRVISTPTTPPLGDSWNG